jgi:hypothetical protein
VLSLVDAVRDAPPCECACHASLSLGERTQGVAALYRLDDALHGWGYQPIYEMGADRLFRAAQRSAGAGYRGIAVRDHACVYRRLVGFLVHEAIHALVGDPAQPNHGIPFGLPYGVPTSLPAVDEAAYLAPFNQQEARAFVGVRPLAHALFGIDWAVYTARDVGTYGFAGGMSLVDVPDGYRPIPHVDRQNEPTRYYALARKLEAAADAWFAAELPALVARFEAAESRGRRGARPAPETLAALPPRVPGRNDPCPCGSGLKYKRCCAHQSAR